MGVQFRDGKVNAGLSFAPGGRGGPSPKDLVRAYGTLANGGKLVYQTTIVTVTDGSGEDLLGTSSAPKPVQALDPGTAGIVTDILAGNTDPKQNPFWGKFKLTDGGKRRPATLKTGTNNDARDLNAYGYIGAPSKPERANGEYALAVGRVERQLGQLARQHPAATRCSRSTSGPTSGRASCRTRRRAGASTGSSSRTGSSRPRSIPGRAWSARAAASP